MGAEAGEERELSLAYLLPLLGLVSGLGVAGFILLSRLSGRIDLILRETTTASCSWSISTKPWNEWIRAFNSPWPEQERDGKQLYADDWSVYLDNLHKEQNNVTLPGEGELVESLTALTSRYHELAEEFFHAADESHTKTSIFGRRAIRVCLPRSSRSKMSPVRFCGSISRTWKKPAGRPGPPPTRRGSGSERPWLPPRSWPSWEPCRRRQYLAAHPGRDECTAPVKATSTRSFPFLPRTSWASWLPPLTACSQRCRGYRQSPRMLPLQTNQPGGHQCPAPPGPGG